MTRFSIITATRNASDTVARCVVSVRDQVVDAEIEHLIADGGSSDGTMAAIAACQSPWIRAVSEPDTGIYDAFNKGIARATGDVLSVLNADDYYLPGALSAVAEIFSDPAIMCVHGNIELVDRRGGTRVVKPRKGVTSFGGVRVFHPSFFCRREVFEKVGVFDPAFRIVADLDFFIRAAAHYSFHYADREFAHFSLGGISTKRRFAATQEVLAILRRHGYPRRTYIRTLVVEHGLNIVSLLR